MNHENNLVTIMIPTYNQRNYVEEAIRSALNQDYEHLEIVISDDASTDGTSDVLTRYTGEPRVQVFVNPTNLGRVANYRLGLYERASGEYVLNLDGDDYLTDPHFISAAVAALRYCPSAVLVFGKRVTHRAVASAGNDVSGDRIKVLDGNELFIDLATRNTEINHMAALYNRRIAMEIGFYRADISSSDRESIYRLILNHNAIRIDRVAGVWRFHKANYSRVIDLSRILLNYESITGPYCEATERTTIPAVVLRRWYFLMLGNRLKVDLKLLARMRCLRLAPALLAYVMRLSPKSVLHVMGNPKTWILLVCLRLGLRS